ncbi:DUF3618 domain-containing protein [Roseovarius spongiae]|uniref:DUF3618 domain-containing protein n=1 Tax=Roseovarius spongiae TaxID=2320272 RepID=A0A3A8B7D7_9RHOB|nr:DUF3618 domain-containing protein [Roseovarius spongiae]RKF12613.1 DUF3618 domain-containing protein [Roseovarius spongiae]
MTNDNRSPEEIERDIKRERAGLSETLDDLQDKFSVETIARQVTDQFREHGGDIGRSVSTAVKSNPVALALTGVGIAWLMMGNRSGDDPGRVPYRHSHDDLDRDRSRDHATLDTREPASGPRARPVRPRPLYSGRYGSSHTAPDWARTRDEDDDAGIAQGARDAAANAGNRVADAASGLGEGARDAGASVADKAKSATASARDAGSSALHSAQDMASSASDRAAALRDRLARGTEDLTEEARQRVVRARERALEAREAAADYARRGSDRAVDIFEEQPLIAGALAVAFGAAVGAVLPRTRVEDEYFGEQSDQLIDEAERILAEEKEKIGKVAETVTEEAKQAARDVKSQADEAAPGSSVEQAAADKVTSAGKRIADAAQSEAEKQDLGDVRKPPKSST